MLEMEGLCFLGARVDMVDGGMVLGDAGLTALTSRRVTGSSMMAMVIGSRYSSGANASSSHVLFLKLRSSVADWHERVTAAILFVSGAGIAICGVGALTARAVVVASSGDHELDCDVAEGSTVASRCRQRNIDKTYWKIRE